MVAVTYGGAPAATSTPAAARTGRSFFKRVYDGICYSQMIRAERELARYRHLLPPNFELGDRRLWTRGKDEPFGGW